MPFLRKIKGFLTNFDFFADPKLLTYHDEPEYKTATGGLITIIIFAVTIALVTTEAILLLQRKNVTGSVHYDRMTDPSYSLVKIGPEGGFMFSLGIKGVNLANNSSKIFDVVLDKHQDRILTGFSSTTSIPLVACTLEHFAFNSAIKEHFTAFQMQEWLCPELNSTFQVEGKISSHIWKRLTLKVNRCDNATTTGCAGDAAVSALQTSLGAFQLKFFVVTTQINAASDTNHISYYMEDRNIFQFTTNFGLKAQFDIEDYTIQTDESITPIPDIDPESGIYAPEPWRYSVRPTATNTHVLITIDKGFTSATFTRKFQKIDQFFAYVGGLIGTVLGLIFVMAFYNQISYNISIASKLFMYDKDTPISSDKFNLLYFFGYAIYFPFYFFFGSCESWQAMRKIRQIKDETISQLDVALLMKKLFFLQKSVELLLPQHYSQLLKAQRKPTLSEAENSRKKYKLYNKLEKEFFDQEKRKVRPSNLDPNNTFQVQSNEIILEGRNQSRQFQEQFSQTSISSIDSMRIEALKAKIHKTRKQSLQGILKSEKIIEKMQKHHIEGILEKERNASEKNKEEEKNQKQIFQKFLKKTEKKEENSLNSIQISNIEEQENN